MALKLHHSFWLELRFCSNNQIFKLFEYSMIQIDYLIMSHVFEQVILNYFTDLGMRRHLIVVIFLKNTIFSKFSLYHEHYNNILLLRSHNFLVFCRQNNDLCDIPGMICCSQIFEYLVEIWDIWLKIFENMTLQYLKEP